MPHFTELTPETALAYAHALAALFDLTVAYTTPHLCLAYRDDNEACDIYEYRLSDDSIAAVWFECGHVYGEA